MLPTRGVSDRSWTVDITASKKKAQQEADPYKSKARKFEQEATQWKDRLNELRKANQDEKAIADAQEKITLLTKEARENASKAEEIENAVYDLKAVNPNSKTEADTRTPDELLEFIEAKGKEITEVLAVLRQHK